MNNKTLASVVKEAREKVGISQRELSRITGIDNNTIAKIEKGERKKPNVLSLKKLSSVLNLSLEDLMELCEYSKEEIEATVNNSYSSMVIKPENAPILVLDDIVNQMQDELYIKMVIKELLDNCNLEKLNIISELDKKEQNRVIKLIKKYTQANEENIKNQKISIDDLKKLLTESK
ncbi:MAG: helix-turn-helix domain-containing protein [Bacilli bacterium]